MTNKEWAFLVGACILIGTLVIDHFMGSIWYALPFIAIGSWIHSKLTESVEKSDIAKLQEENEALKAEIAKLKQENQDVK